MTKLADTLARWHDRLAVAFAATLLTLGAVVEYLTTVAPQLAPYFGKWGGLVTIGIGVANVLLRIAAQRAAKAPPK